MASGNKLKTKMRTGATVLHISVCSLSSNSLETVDDDNVIHL
jgi:hypothetical protein